MESCQYYKTLWETAQSEVGSFRERSNCPRVWYRDLRIRIWGLEIKHLKAHLLRVTRCFFFHYDIATSTNSWTQIFTGLFFCAYVEIHLVKRLVFDNYQTCPLYLMTTKTKETKSNIIMKKKTHNKKYHLKEWVMLSTIVIPFCKSKTNGRMPQIGNGCLTASYQLTLKINCPLVQLLRFINALMMVKIYMYECASTRGSSLSSRAPFRTVVDCRWRY